jgi:hypothetical protein
MDTNGLNPAAAYLQERHQRPAILACDLGRLRRPAIEAIVRDLERFELRGVVVDHAHRAPADPTVAGS